ncbi:hypothetical protein L2D04_22695 (plasmid) [Pantoea agglomerans]|uniref:hypothetical protein n=1 Tax=Enterobacter agglomerans TaxID=549 RepID=UPI001F277B9C|nr:hypothetical protein [Pantoea agglomerans]UJQ26193.1 hypothetical protein L2D04_22695 [Pantoea agglomerans]
MWVTPQDGKSTQSGQGGSSNGSASKPRRHNAFPTSYHERKMPSTPTEGQF